MSALITTYALPILQSIIASRMDSGMAYWAKSADASDEGRFCQIMKRAFINAVKKVKGDTPKVVKDSVDELFDECRDALMKELCTMEPAQVAAYVSTGLYEAFKAELENTDEAIPYINETLLKSIQQQTIGFDGKLRELCRRTSVIESSTAEILAISRRLMNDKGLSACSIIPYIEGVPFVLPELCSERPVLVSAMAIKLRKDKALVLYAGVQEGKTIASRLVAKRLMTEYHVIEIDMAYRNELNLEYILEAYDAHDKYLFILDGVRYEDALYESFCRLIKRFANDDRLFVINCYDKISDYVFDGLNALPEMQLPPMNEEEVKEMVPQECRGAYSELIMGLCQGQPFLTHALCAYFNVKGWTLPDDDIASLFTFSHANSLRKKVKLLLQRTVGNNKAYSLLNRLMTLGGTFTGKHCADLAAFNPILSNPNLLLGQLVGTWVLEDNGEYRVSSLLRKAAEPDLLPQEARDCYNYEASRLIMKRTLTPSDVLTVLNCYIRAGELDKAGGFYIMMLMKLKEQRMLDMEGASLMKAIWVGVSLPQAMSIQVKLSVRCMQLIVLDHLKKPDVDCILKDISALLETGCIDRTLYVSTVYAVAGFCLLNDCSEQAVLFQKKWLSVSPDGQASREAKDMALVSLGNVKTTGHLYTWMSLYASLGCPEDDLFSEGALVVVNRIYDNAVEDEKERVLRDIIAHAESCKADVFTVIGAAKLIDHFGQYGRDSDVRTVWKDMSGMSSSPFGELLLNYAYGLGLYNKDAQEESYSYLEKAAHAQHIGKACMVALNARCTYAQIVADKGQKAEAVFLIKELVEHSDFSKIYTLWEQDAAMCTLAYALWEDGRHEEAVDFLLKVEHHLWSVRNNDDAGYVNLSVRFVVLVLYIHTQSVGKAVDEKFATPDYRLFVKPSPSVDQVYKPERNFTKEQLLYELAERYAGEDAALMIIEHMMDFQREDAAQYAHLLSVMVQAFPLCLKKGRKDIVEYIILTVLSAPGIMSGTEKASNCEQLVLAGSLLSIAASRALCIMEGQAFDEEWLFDMMEKARPLLKDSSSLELVTDQMLSPSPQYDKINDVLLQEVVYLYHFCRVPFSWQLSLLWGVCKSLDAYGNMPSAQRVLKRFVSVYAKFLIKEHPDKFDIDVCSADKLFSKVEQYDRMGYVIKIIQGIFFHIKGNIEVSEGMNEFLYD